MQNGDDEQTVNAAVIKRELSLHKSGDGTLLMPLSILEGEKTR